MRKVVALLRAVNVGGTGKLPMSELKRICADEGFTDVRTYIASGNVVFATEMEEAAIRQRLEARLAEYAGKPMDVMVRTGPELAAVLAANPFAGAPGNSVAVVFFNQSPPDSSLDAVTGRADEEIVAGAREVYVHYPSGMGRSKLSLKALGAGTARNLNTVARLAEMAAKT